jgi:hypothetical protein
MVKIRIIVFAILLIYLLAACRPAATVAVPATAAPATAAPATAAPATAAPATAAPATAAPATVAPATAVPPTATTQPISTLTIQEQFTQIDTILRQTTDASIAYNTPNTMKLDETVTIELLMNPSLSAQQLKSQVTENGEVTTATINITPRIRAKLTAADEDTFIIQPIQDSAEQIISGTETTKWSWMITAKKVGLQTLILTIYRLVKYEDQDYWREVETYKASIKVKVTLWQKIMSIDWKWLFSLLPISLIWAWIAKRFQSKRTKQAED